MSATGLTIHGGTVVTFDPVTVEARDLHVPGGPRRILDAGGCLVLPGLVVAHTHLYSGLARGMPGPNGPTRNFREILERVWWRLDVALDEATLAAAAEVALLEALLAGATTVIDHHESPSFIDGSLDVIAEAAQRVGVRALLCYGATDRHGEKGARAGLVECERALRAGRSAMVGLHAGFTVHDQTLDWAAELCRLGEAWLHVHAAEDRCDGESFVRLEEHGLIGPRTILAHGVHLTPGERARAAAVGAWIVHNPRSNLQNAVGYADPNSIPGPTALGTDGMDGDLFTEARVAHLAGRQAHGPLGGIDAFGLVTGSQRLGDALLGPRPGDWIVLDYDPPTPLDAGNFPGHFLFGLGATHVRDVIVNGEVVVEGRRPTLVDRHEVMARAREQAARLWKRL